MNLKRIIPLLLAISLFLTACSPSGADELELEKQEFQTVAELTRDEQREGIITTISESDAPSSVTVYYKIEDKWYSMYQVEAGTEKNEQRGIYICKKGGESCLIDWKPSTDKEGNTTLQYQIFYLKYDIANKCGRMIVVEEDSVTFTSGQIEPEGDKYDEAHQFVTKLNKYLKKSAALVDTVGGDIVYSPDTKSKAYKLYEPKWFDSDYKSTPSASATATASATDSDTDASSTLSSAESEIDETVSDSVDDADRYKTEDTGSAIEETASEE